MGTGVQEGERGSLSRSQRAPGFRAAERSAAIAHAGAELGVPPSSRSVQPTGQRRSLMVARRLPRNALILRDVLTPSTRSLRSGYGLAALTALRASHKGGHPGAAASGAQGRSRRGFGS